MTREDIYISGCMFAVNKLIEDGSSRFAIKVNDEWETVPWNELMEWLEQEPKTGDWIKETLVMPLSDATKDCYRCNNCGLHFDCTSKYCPNCGAKMGREIGDKK